MRDHYNFATPVFYGVRGPRAIRAHPSGDLLLIIVLAEQPYAFPVRIGQSTTARRVRGTHRFAKIDNSQRRRVARALCGALQAPRRRIRAVYTGERTPRPRAY